MELKMNTISLARTMAKGTAHAAADGDVIVPDIKPDILKLLQVDADSCITEKYIENGRLVICGRVDYKVLYIPDKENEKIKSILTSMDFRQVTDAGGAPPDCEIMAASTVERVEFNSVNSRKIRLRAMVAIDYELCTIAEAGICSGVEDESTECTMQTVEYENTVDISEHEFTVKETLEVPPGQTSIGELLKTDVRITDTEYKAVTGKLIVKGSAGICILYTDEDGEIKYIESEVPFTEVFDAERVGENTICDVDYSVMRVMCEIEPDNDGDMRVAELDIDIAAAVIGVEPEKGEILRDCFVPYMKTKKETERLTLTETIERPSAQNTIREIIDFPANAPGVSAVYNVMTNTVVAKAEMQRNKIICEGKIEAYILYLTDSGENPVYSLKKDIPFSYMLDCERGGEKPDIAIKAEVGHISYNLNSAGALELRCLLAIDGRLEKTTVIDNIVSVEAEPADKRSGIIVYFSKEGDSLWDIAKHYAVPVERIASHNNLDSDRIERGTKLFVPAGR